MFWAARHLAFGLWLQALGPLVTGPLVTGSLVVGPFVMGSLVLGSLVLGLGAPASIARAQPPDRESAATAQRAFDAGVEAAREDRWAEALGLFQRAYELLPDPQLLVNLATAQAHLGQLIDARQSYLRALNALPNTDEELRQLTDEGINSLERRIPEVRLQLEGIGADDVVWIDDVVVMDLQQPWLLDPGDHALTVRRGGQPLAQMRFSLAEGDRRTLSLAVGSGLLAPSGVEGDSADPTLWENPWLWVGVGVAAVVLTTLTVIIAVSASGRPDPIDGAASGFQPFSGTLNPGTLVLE